MIYVAVALGSSAITVLLCLIAYIWGVTRRENRWQRHD
jgi:hypothetical protein